MKTKTAISIIIITIITFSSLIVMIGLSTSKSGLGSDFENYVKNESAINAYNNQK